MMDDVILHKRLKKSFFLEFHLQNKDIYVCNCVH